MEEEGGARKEGKEGEEKAGGDVNDNCDGSSPGSTCDPRQAASATLPRPLRERFTVTQHAKMDEKAMHVLMVMNRMWKSDGEVEEA
ncbi:hypothetical protein E2C01_041945 [Portunus trituberculatus]|uniref:Uncharacterized protein n=1 Tax=Portunus trituberculatus TaxID=210409 RepID=A0A5B7FS25_PORTR|nr:hypothetical protein [Portunus trituberculatus]